MADGETSGSGALLRGLLELVAEELGMGRGTWRLELRFRDGRLQQLYRHDEQIPPGALDRVESDLRGRVLELIGGLVS